MVKRFKSGILSLKIIMEWSSITCDYDMSGNEHEVFRKTLAQIIKANISYSMKN